MKIFTEAVGSFSDKVNFVDKNNVVLGFDYSQCCCESFGYFFHKTLDKYDVSQDDWVGLNLYCFDPEFFQENVVYPCSDGGGSATFRLVTARGAQLFLTLYNHHNGYYGHGFKFATPVKVLQDGGL